MSDPVKTVVAVREQQPPTPNNRPAVWNLVIEDMRQRDADGRAKYGVPLQSFNGRDPLVDAYQEALDLTVYLRQAIEEVRELRAERDALQARIDGLVCERDLARADLAAAWAEGGDDVLEGDPE